jgi:hypothetical protein
MAAVTLLLPGAPPPDPATPKVVISRDGFAPVPLSLASPETDHSDLAGGWQELSRPGAAPLLNYAGGKLPKIRLEAILDERLAWLAVYGVDRGGDDSSHLVEDQLRALEAIEAGLWRIANFTWKATLRAPGDHHVVRATCTFDLTRASDPPPISRAPAAPPPLPPSAPTPAPAAPAGRTYTVKAGDTLWVIAQRTYGNGNVWSRIADANGIRDPRRLAVGQVLRLP